MSKQYSVYIDGQALKEWIHDELQMTVEEFADSICYSRQAVSRAIQNNIVSLEMLYLIFEQYDINREDELVEILMGDDFDYNDILGM